MSTATATATAGTTARIPAAPAGAAGPQVSTVALLARARCLRAQAGRVNPVLAEAYLRRSAELRMEAWARAARRAPTPLEGFANPGVAAA
jgi:hypothetical protein